MSDDDSSDEEERQRVQKVDELKHLRDALREQYEPFLNDSGLMIHGADATDADTLLSLKQIHDRLNETRLPQSKNEAEKRLEALRHDQDTLMKEKKLFEKLRVKAETAPKHKEQTTVASFEIDSSSEEEDNNCIAWRIPRRVFAAETKSRAPKMSREASSSSRSHNFFETRRPRSNGGQPSSQQPQPHQSQSFTSQQPQPHSLQPYISGIMPTTSNPSAAAEVDFDWRHTQIPGNLANAQPPYVMMPQFTQIPRQNQGYYSQHTVYVPPAYNIACNPMMTGQFAQSFNAQPQMQYPGYPLSLSNVLPNIPDVNQISIYNQNTTVMQSSSAFPHNFSQQPPSFPCQPFGNLQQQQHRSHQQKTSTLPQRDNRFSDTRYGGVVSSSTPSQDVRLYNQSRNPAAPKQWRNFTQSRLPRQDQDQRFEPQPSTTRNYAEYKRQKKQMEARNDPRVKRQKPNDEPKRSKVPNGTLNKPKSSSKVPPRKPSEGSPRELDASMPKANQIGQPQPSLDQPIEPPELDSITSDEAAMPQVTASSEMPLPTSPPKPKTSTTSKTPSAASSSAPATSLANSSPAFDASAVTESQGEPQAAAMIEIISNEILEQAPAPAALSTQHLIRPDHIKIEKIAEPEEAATTCEHSVIDSLTQALTIKTEFKREAYECETDSNHGSDDDTDNNSGEEHCGPGEQASEQAGEEDSEDDIPMTSYFPMATTQPSNS